MDGIESSRIPGAHSMIMILFIANDQDMFPYVNLLAIDDG